MPNPTINFRLSPYQIARGLWIVRKLEPNYTPTSAGQLVKMLYLDYLAKMSIGRSDVVPADLVQEAKELCSTPRSKELTLDDLMEHQPTQQKEQPTQESETQSQISTVTDFSPPDAWLTDDND